jgi:hypothetical protein
MQAAMRKLTDCNTQGDEQRLAITQRQIMLVGIFAPYTHGDYRDRYSTVVNTGTLCLGKVRHHHQAAGRKLHAKVV